MTINVNFLSPIGFIFSLSKIPNANFLIQRVSIPGITLGKAAVATPHIQLNEPGKIQFDELRISFAINEDLTSYLDIVTWMLQRGDPYGLGSQPQNKYDASVTILDSSKRPSITFAFDDVYPTSISSIDLDATLSEPMPVIAEVSFSYDTMKVR